jgi:hypothetical protein
MIRSLLDQAGGPTLATRRIGPPRAFERLWRETGCRTVIEDLAVGRGFGFSLERACFPSASASRGGAWSPIAA